jgi:hypothetical protein
MVMVSRMVTTSRCWILHSSIAIHILEEQRVAHAQHLTVDLEGTPAVCVLDPEIVAEGNQLFAHFIAGGTIRRGQRPGVALVVLGIFVFS